MTKNIEFKIKVVNLPYYEKLRVSFYIFYYTFPLSIFLSSLACNYNKTRTSVTGASILILLILGTALFLGIRRKKIVQTGLLEFTPEAIQIHQEKHQKTLPYQDITHVSVTYYNVGVESRYRSWEKTYGKNVLEISGTESLKFQILLDSEYKKNQLKAWLEALKKNHVVIAETEIR